MDRLPITVNPIDREPISIDAFGISTVCKRKEKEGFLLYVYDEHRDKTLNITNSPKDIQVLIRQAYKEAKAPLYGNSNIIPIIVNSEINSEPEAEQLINADWILYVWPKLELVNEPDELQENVVVTDSEDHVKKLMNDEILRIIPETHKSTCHKIHGGDKVCPDFYTEPK